MSARGNRQRGKQAPAGPGPAEPGRRTWSPQRLASVAVVLVALALRAAYLLSIRDAYFFRALQTNPERYDRWARLIVAGHSPPPPFEQSPGYAYFLAGVYSAIGTGIGRVALVQAILDAGTCALIAAVTRRCFGARAGLIAGLLAAGYGPFVYFAAQILPATLFLFIAVAAVYASTRRSWLGAGLLWAAALGVRSESLLACPLVCFDAWRRGGRAAALRTAVPPALVLAAFVVFNAAFAHRFVLSTTSGGANLWLGNNPYADGVSPFASGPLAAVADEVRAAGEGDPIDIDRLFRGRAVEFWRSDPAQAAKLAWKRFLWTWTHRELPNTSDIEWEMDHSWLFLRPWFPFGFGTILPLALGGMALGGAPRRAPLALGAPLAIGLGTTIVFFTNARFRLVLVPGLLPFAAALLANGANLFRSRATRRREILRVGAGMALGVVAAWGNFGGVDRYRIPEIDVNTGVVAREAGDFDTAVRFLRAGLAASPGDDIAWVHLALALEQAGDARAAGQAYLEGLARVPASPELRARANRFARVHGLGGDFAERYLGTPPGPERDSVAVELLRPLGS